MDLGAHDFKTKPYVTVSLSMILWCFRGTLADDNTRSARSVSETFFSPPDPQPVQLHATTTCQGESLDISSVKIAYFGGWNYRLYKSPKGDVQHREISVPMWFFVGQIRKPSGVSRNHSRKFRAIEGHFHARSTFSIWIGPFMPYPWHIWSFELNSTDVCLYWHWQSNRETKHPNFQWEHHLINRQYTWMDVSMGDFPLSG